MVVTGGTLAALTGQITAGYHGGAWNGTGIISSVAAGNSTHLTALGVIPNTIDGTTPLYDSSTTLGPFDGASPGATALLVKYTYYGDANLDGHVDGTDYSRIDNGYASHLTGWFNGDFNYDTQINGSDYTLIDNAFNTQGAALTSEIGQASVAPKRPVFPGPSTPATADSSSDLFQKHKKRPRYWES
jgi:hypothetical protein